MIAKAQVYAAEAAINVLRNEFKLASNNIEASRMEIPNMMDKGVAIALADKLEELEKRINLTFS